MPRFSICSRQAALFRLTYALETAKEMHWIYRLLADREWSGRHALVINVQVSGIFLSRSSLDAAFDDDGKQIAPIMARVTGNVEGLAKLLDRCRWQLALCQDKQMPYLFQLIASLNGVPRPLAP